MAQDKTYTFRPGQNGGLKIGDEIEVRVTWGKLGDVRLRITQKPRHDISLLGDEDLDVRHRIQQN